MSNSLRETANELSSKLVAIRLILNYPSNEAKVFVLLEGETDIRLFKKLFDLNKVEVDSLQGKEKVIQALQILLTEGYSQVIGIKDADFDHLEETQAIENLFTTDYHDMEVSMIESDALQSLICEYAHTQSNNAEFLSNLKKNIYDSAITIGYLRWFNHKQISNKLLFKNLDFKIFVQQNDYQLNLDKEKLCARLLDDSKKKNSALSIASQELDDAILHLKTLSADKLQICCGHDLTKLIALALGNNLNGDKIESALRLSYSLDYFKKTNLYVSLMNWSSNSHKTLFAS
ncbi:MAG: DUF4435 domain-containing protein [Sulfuricurvum sp.]|uniref:DUF4435 domain-containing protein n=1 Tax=Sulfuricurvum sp. TaxID=2025608 RepID=UPI0025E14710|nr:DUF4435 domain-containing protein [Sulfuricurvum sp.]MCI4407447.1 DUF4435 domain-containing protein [Sulfuricurvum sp.]